MYVCIRDAKKCVTSVKIEHNYGIDTCKEKLYLISV
jgi:hypothetical protein